MLEGIGLQAATRKASCRRCPETCQGGLQRHRHVLPAHYRLDLRSSSTSLSIQNTCFMSAKILIPQPLSRSFLRWLPPRRTWQQQLRRNTHQAQRPQIIETCPSPLCACQDMPPLDIERDKPLDGTMAAYHEHVVIPTGRVDWTSRIEEDPHLPLVKELKDSLGPKGRYSNVRRPHARDLTTV